MQLGNFVSQVSNQPAAIDNTNYYLILLTVILACITAYYAWQTKRSVMALEESTKAQFKPFIKASLSMIGPVALDLMVVNIGKGSAVDVSIRFHVIEIPNSERQWTQELMLPDAHQKFFIPTGQTQTQLQTEFFENNQTTLEFEWECKDILGKRHFGNKQIDITEFVRQMNRTQAMYEENFEDEVSRATKEISDNIRGMRDSLREISRNMPKQDID